MGLKLESRELGLCPKCTAPLEFTYTLTGPEGGDSITVSLIAECGICGYRESRSLVFPLTALYTIRHLFQPTVKIFIERVRLAYELKRIEELKVTLGAEA
ncbi:MAG: hypothetical protein QXD28_06460 [Acidilobaceae archaeon]